MGGSGGSSPSQTTVNQPTSKAQVDPIGAIHRWNLLPKLKEKYDVGLTPQERKYYIGQGLGAVEGEAAGNLKTLKENFARMGIGPGDGAMAESIANLLRQKLATRAGVYSDVMGKDIAQKQQNLINYLSLINEQNPSVGTGSSTTTTSGGTGSTAKNVIGGALGGALGGYAATGNPMVALGGGILGGLGGIF